MFSIEMDPRMWFRSSRGLEKHWLLEYHWNEFYTFFCDRVHLMVNILPTQRRSIIKLYIEKIWNYFENKQYMEIIKEYLSHILYPFSHIFNTMDW